MRSIVYQILVKNRNLKQITETDISVTCTTDHSQGTVKRKRKKNHKTLKASDYHCNPFDIVRA